MGEDEPSLKEPPPKTIKDSDNKLVEGGGVLLKKDECSLGASSKILHSSTKRRRVEEGFDVASDCITQNQSDLKNVSPSVIKSRYGRTHKPKIPEDFLPTDKKVAAILGHSPNKSPGKGAGSPVSATPELAKVCQKGQRLYDIFVKKDRRSKGNIEIEKSSRNSSTEKLGISNVKSEKPQSDNVESFPLKLETTPAENTILCPENVREEIESDLTDKTFRSHEMSAYEEKVPGCEWVIGDLAWARVSGYPFWPCMISLDPQQRIFTKTTVRGNFTLRSLHVQFFGDNGRRSWLFSNCVIRFEGLEALNKLAAKMQSEVKKRDRKFVAAFHVAPKAKAKWDVAVKEAEAAINRTRVERLQDFARQFLQVTSATNSETHNSSPCNRQQKQASDKNSPKMKSMEASPCAASPDPLIEVSDKYQAVAVTPDSKLNISSPMEKRKQKKQQHKKPPSDGQNSGADFETYLYRNLQYVSMEHPEWSTKMVEEYIFKEWTATNCVRKPTFCIKFRNKNEVKHTESSSSEEDVDEERESHCSEKADSREARDSSPTPFFKIKKGGGLFRGTKQEKVCQICEKPGDTVKCRGPCSGTFHLECLSKSVAVKENINATTPRNFGINETDYDASVEMKEIGDRGVNALTNGSDPEEEIPKPVNCTIDLVDHVSLLEEKEDGPVARKRMRLASDEDIIVSEKKDFIHSTLCKNNRDEESEEDETVKKEISEGNEEHHGGVEEEREGCIQNVESDMMKEGTEEAALEEMTVDLKTDSTGIEVKENEIKVVDNGKEKSKGDAKEGSLGTKENTTEGSNSGEVLSPVVEQVVIDKGVSGMENSSDKENKESEKHVVGHRGNVDVHRKKGERGEVEPDLDESRVRIKGTTVSEEKDRYKMATRGFARKRISEGYKEIRADGEEVKTEVEFSSEDRDKGMSDLDESRARIKGTAVCEEKDKCKVAVKGYAKKRAREDDKEIRADGEVKKDIEISPEDKDKGETKERIIAKKRDKEEKGKDDVTEGKTATDAAAEFRCRDCREGRNPPCFACGKIAEEKTGRERRQRCAVGHCGKFYHTECLKLWPQAWSSGSASSRRQSAAASRGGVAKGQAAVTCPQHVCHTCASDDPRNAATRFAHERLVRCIRCPTAYHTGNYCLPAGSEVLTGTQIICPRHYEPPQKKTYHVNAAWCFICAMGGSLICCDLCPTSFHAECLQLSPPEGSFICEDCDTGRFPLYGEIVWVKLGSYRWWPAQILYPSQIPENIQNLPHVRGEFAVRFFGSHDHYWVNRGRVFLYQEGDTGHNTNRKSYMEDMFNRALLEASEAHKALEGEKATRDAEARPVMKPPMYVKIKSNKPVGNVRLTEMDLSSMTPCDCDPNSANPCGPDTDCLNRILLVECSLSVCMAGEKCGNQCFEKRQYPPLTPYRTETRGWGLKTLADIRKGDFVIEYVGEMVDEAEYQCRMMRKHEGKDENYYFLTIDKDRILDAGPKGNVARFMNHSCQPNCETQKWTVNGDTRVGLFALEDIPADTELTFNYNLECVGPDKKPCMCGAPKCSGFIGVKVNKVEEDKKSRIDLQNLAKRRKKRRSSVKVNSDVCFICGEGGELLQCDNKTCPKGYHLLCLKLERSPLGKWLCPWHRCNECNKRTTRRCGFCPNSYCPQHADGNIRVHPAIGLVCQDHDDGTSVNVKEGTECLTEADKMETDDDETSEESSSLKVKLNYADEEIKENVRGDKDTGKDTKNESKSSVSSEESILKQCLEDGTVARESDLPLSNQGRNGLYDKVSASHRRNSTDLNEEKCSENNVLMKNDVCSHSDDMVADVKSVVMCAEEVMVHQNITEDVVKVTNGIEKRKRGRPRKPRVGENLNLDGVKNNGTCVMSHSSKMDLNNELENLAENLPGQEVFNRNEHKPSRRHKEKSVNDLQDAAKKRRVEERKILSDVLHKPGEMDFQDNCGGIEGLGQETAKEENENLETVMESRPSEVKADLQKLCNETKSTSSNVVAANGIEASSVLILPVES